MHAKCLILLLLVGSLAACRGAATGASQVLAQVNGDEISVHQLDLLLAGLRGEPSEADATRLLERLIDRQLAVQQAQAAQLERRPEVMLRLEEARRDVLAAAWAEAQRSSAPLDENQLASYYRAHPGLFAERRIYRLRETILPAGKPPAGEVERQLAAGVPLATVLAGLQPQVGQVGQQSVQRAAEQLPVAVVDRLHPLSPGAVVSFRSPQALVIYQVQSFESAPLAWSEARPLIARFLREQQDKATLEAALQQLRSTAKISKKPERRPSLPAVG